MPALTAKQASTERGSVWDGFFGKELRAKAASRKTKSAMELAGGPGLSREAEWDWRITQKWNMTVRKLVPED